MKRLTRRTSAAQNRGEVLEPLSTREWLLTNGLGGYASGTVSGVITRRYHGLLIAALPAPLGRTLTLAHLSEQIRLADGRVVRLFGGPGAPGPAASPSDGYLAEFRLETGLPVWRYEVEGMSIERQLILAHGQNTVYVTYRLLSGAEALRLKVMPSIHFRSHDAPVSTPLPLPFRMHAEDGRYELKAAGGWPPLRMTFLGHRAAFTSEPRRIPEMLYPVEESRGYESTGDLWSPGYFRIDLVPDQQATLIASTEPWEEMLALSPDEAYEAEAGRRRRLLAAAQGRARHGTAAELAVAADQFIIRPATRTGDAVRVQATGDEAVTVIAGYHWFTDWGRDTMISLEGLTLTTGRHVEANHILRTFSHYVRDGLIPNLFPEGKNEGLYHTADATLWFFHAIDRYAAVTGDRAIISDLMPRLLDIVKHHVRGTRYGIGADERDGLLRQGAPGCQLTWMDAKMGDWVVTPRRGKAVEINALWYNALRLMECWTREYESETTAREMAERADRARESFNRRFWYEEGGYLYDVVDAEGGGDDPACRPNQIFAISLPNPVLDADRWEHVLEVVRGRLLTPVGLRSLAPDHAQYQPKYFGDLRARDGAYHQGTVWAWLIGPFIDAWLRVYPDDRAGARRFLDGFQQHLDDACIGSISEIFDAEYPFTPRGCIAQAWSVAEVLRALVKTAECDDSARAADAAARRVEFPDTTRGDSSGRDPHDH